MVACFYSEVTTDFIIRFGYKFDLGNTSDDTPTTEHFDSVDGEKIPGTTAVSEEEAKRQKKYYKRLRGVHNFILVLYCSDTTT